MARDSTSGRVVKRNYSALLSSTAVAMAGAKGKAVLQELVNELDTGQPRSLEKAAKDELDVEMLDGSQSQQQDSDSYSQSSQNGDEEQYSISNGDKKSFPLFKLPAEIRNEIYRACLTRPFNVLLAKPEPPRSQREHVPSAGNAALSDEESVGEGLFGPGPNLPSSPYVQGTSTDSQDSSINTASADSSSSQVDANVGQATWSSSIPNTGLRAWANRSARAIRFQRGASRSTVSITSLDTPSVPAQAGYSYVSRNTRSTQSASCDPEMLSNRPPRTPRPQDVDPLLVNVLRVNKQVYQEARAILYSENFFTLDLDNALLTLAALHQRSRRQIKHVEVEIPCYNEILERFQETVRLGLRYCWGLKQLVIHMPFTLPGADGSGTTGNTTVYANGFDILRWLPRQSEVILRGNVCPEIEAVVSKNAKLAKTLDDVRIPGECVHSAALSLVTVRWNDCSCALFLPPLPY